VTGPSGTLSGAKGKKDMDKSWVDRIGLRVGAVSGGLGLDGFLIKGCGLGMLPTFLGGLAEVFGRLR
jgi:hypothetical protein